MNLETLDLLVDLGARGQQSRHHDERAQVRRHSVVKLERGNHGGTDYGRHGAIHQRDRRIHRRNYREHRENEPGQSADAGVHNCQQPACDDYRSDDRDGAEIALDPGRRIGASDPVAHRRTKSQLSFERVTPL